MKPVSTDVRFPDLEREILQFWEKHRIREKGLEANAGAEPFVFYDGPPFATGLPHHGHILAGTLKDVVTRYWVMKGRYVRRKWGWDCHGLPVEFEMEKELGLSGKTDIENYGIAKFNEACRGIVLRYTAEWEKIITRGGRWADFKNAYRTMDRPFMESVWWVVKQLFDRGLVYEGYRVMPYSWRIATPLSNFEAGLNYQNVQDPAVFVRFREAGAKRAFLAWTTTPWTLPSNLALAVHPDIEYGEYEIDGETVVFATAALGRVVTKDKTAKLVRTFLGRQLEGTRYEPLFPFFADRAKDNAFQVTLGEHVTTEDGTGIVHTAPAFGEEDFEVCKRYRIPLVDPVDAEGKFTAAVPPYAGQQVKEADRAIIKDLKEKGALFRQDTIQHNYPYCWRSDTPLIYKAISTWFVRLDDALKQRLLDNNAKTRWVPEHLRDGRFGKWLASARDWNISRNRYWGTPIPIWRSDDGELYCVGSIDELEKLAGRNLPDIHKHFVDDITFPSPKTGKLMRRIPEVLDCWFESGSMPYAQLHYPFENQDAFRQSFPAHFIAEGMDQTRGWFYTLSVLSAALWDKPGEATAPFQNVIVNGLVLAEDGKKMSKRLKNYPEPMELFEKYGADALRAYLITSPAARGDDLRFSEAGLKEIVRSVLLPYWNAYGFFVTYALAEGWRTDLPGDRTPTDLDRWLVSRFHTLVGEVDRHMADYQLSDVVPKVLGFLEELTNWYIRLNRRRFWMDGWDGNKRAAFATLYEVLTGFTRVLAPMLPFVTEAVYQNLERRWESDPESIHLCRLPEADTTKIDRELEAEMAILQRVVALGRRCRSDAKIKTRQPLRRLRVFSQDATARRALEKYRDLVTSELNVETVELGTDDSAYVDVVVKPDFKALGVDFGKSTPVVAGRLKSLTGESLSRLLSGESIVLDESTVIRPHHVSVVRTPKQGGAVASDGALVLWIDTTLDEALLRRGLSREVVNRIQRLRKQLGLNVTDRVTVTFEAAPELRAAIEAHAVYIRSETLADALDAGTGPWLLEDDLDGLPLRLAVAKR
jgi:isoleucyl-tRNA synthetase